MEDHQRTCRLENTFTFSSYQSFVFIFLIYIFKIIVFIVCEKVEVVTLQTLVLYQSFLYLISPSQQHHH
jgi:hypothetical protein